jgi:hypothetical protein
LHELLSVLVDVVAEALKISQNRLLKHTLDELSQAILWKAFAGLAMFFGTRIGTQQVDAARSQAHP